MIFSFGRLVLLAYYTAAITGPVSKPAFSGLSQKAYYASEIRGDERCADALSREELLVLNSLMLSVQLHCSVPYLLGGQAGVQSGGPRVLQYARCLHVTSHLQVRM